MARPLKRLWALWALCACARAQAELHSEMAGTASDAVHSQITEAAQDGAAEVTGAPSTVSSASAAGEENWQVLQSSSLKIAVLADGGLGQPFYRSQQTNGWTKLTYGSKHMDYAIKVDGHLAKLSGDLDVVKTTGSEFAARSQVILHGVPQAQVLRSYSFLGDGMVFNITFTFTALTDVTDLQVYLGTSDDWIGTSDQPRKEQGHFVQGQFQPEAHGKVLRVQSSDEAVFAFSPNPDSHAIILQHYGNFADVYAATMSDMSRSTSDGAYGIYVPCGRLARGEKKSATIFYAAAAASQLDQLIENSAKANRAGHAALSLEPQTDIATEGMEVALPPATPAQSTTPESSGTAPPAPKVFLESHDLKIGVMNDGSLDQPFYYSQSTKRWTKLTYGHKKLDLAVKVNGQLATLGSEAIVDHGTSSASTSTSSRSVAVRSQLMVDGVSKGEVLRSYDFVGDGLVLKMTFSFSASLTPLSDVKVWLGTSDDWIGEDDRPTKETGDFDHGFVPSKGGKILRVQSGEEEVFAFSPNPGSKAIILQHYGNWPRVYASDQSDVSRSSSDGAYAIYVPLGSVELGQTKEAVIFYAASGANELEHLAEVSEEADEVAETAESSTADTAATTATATAASTTTAPGLAVLQTDFLKIAVMEDGSLGQPFYFSSQRAPRLDLGTGQVKSQRGGWTKLTYGNKQLDSAIKVDGHLAHLSGAAIESSGERSLATRSQLSVDGRPKAEVLRSYGFAGDGMVLNITYSFTALSSLSNLQVWLGTSDDWIGSSDQPTKEQGSFVAGSFVATAHGNVLRVESGEEAVFVFSPQESHAIILQHYGNWPAVTAATSSDLERSTSDGAYAIYVPLGPLAAGETKKATVFYAAAAASQLSHLLRVTDEVAKSERPTTSSTAATTTTALPTTAETTTTTQPGLAVLQTDFLKIAVLQDGSLGQPFYMSDERGWTKLTYASQKLDYAIKVDGKLAAVGGDPAVESSASSSLASRAQLTLEGSPKAEVLRSYNFLGQGMVLNVTYTFTALAPINELEVWLGTSDDWIGSSDRPTKEQGSFRGGNFVPAAHGQILQVQSGEESVLIFSPNPDSHAIILEHYGNWPAVSASKRSDLARSTSDGAYAIYVPLGSLSPGQKISATIFYAAAGADRLQELLRVAEEVKPSSTSTTTWLMPSTSTTALAYVLQSPYLKIGLLGNGGLGQPFYKSKGTGWTKLTYSQLHLSTTVKIDGEIADLGRRVSLHFRDAEYCTVTEELSVRGVTQAVLKRTYSFTGNGLVFQANFSFQALKALDNVEVWFGTSDDWIGTTDRPLKEQGKFVDRSFEPTEHGHILRIHSGDENVFVFSTHPDSHAIIRAEYGRWSLIHAARHSELASSRSDGAYGIYVPLGSFRPQGSHSASFFYAAAEESRLAELLDHASAVDGGEPASSTTVGTPPSTTSSTLPANMLETSFLRFKLLDRGGLGQPFYYSPYAGWTQLTYANKSLECTVKVDGNVVEVDSDRDKVKWWDYENAMATTQLRRQGVPSATLTRSYGFKQEGMIFMANFSFTALTDISSLQVWLGTSDDYIGVTDQPTKIQGDFGELGTFEAKRNGDVLHIYSGQESVLMFSPNRKSQAIILRHYGRWHEIEVSTKSDLHESSSDGAYGIYVSLGELKAGETKSAIFYYGASTADQLKPLSRAASALKVHRKIFHSNELLVWDVDRCNMQKANSSVDCDLAHSCYGTLWNSRSACRVMLVNTMTIAELKNYICGNSTCAYEARDARKECEAIYPNDMGWLDPIHHYRHRYCGLDEHATDLINDHDTCASLHSPVETHFCKTVRKCYKGFEQVGTSCKVDLPTMAQMQTELCSVSCREAIDQVLTGCGHYRVVRDAADSVTAYQRYFGCDQGASLGKQGALLPAPVLGESPLQLQVEASTGDFWHSKAATYLTSAYEHCTSATTPASEAKGEACQKAVSCFDKLQEAQESCGVIWLPTMTVTEVSKYVCSGSICHGHALHLQENCSHYHRVAAVLRPVAYYQEKYCPSWEQDKTHYRDPNLVNDLYLCTIRKHKRESPLCTTVIQCNEQISAVDRQCSGNAGTTEETMDLVCSNPCRSFIESAAMYCANYSYLMHSLQAYRVYMNVFECNNAVEDENPVAACIRNWKIRMRRILDSAGSTTGAFILTSLVGVSIAFATLRSISLRWYCSPPGMGYECIADDEVPWTSRWDEEMSLTSRLDEELLLVT